ncbi:Ubiquitin-conjugating enzyme family protein [Hirschfeldia incana]|nr:Ubiquitin-conjugating enzyme family protein [Hirschfeldia incana]
MRRNKRWRLKLLKLFLLMNSKRFILVKVGLILLTDAFRLLSLLRMMILRSRQSHQLGLVFSHTENYPDEVPLLDVKSIRGIHVSDLTILKEKLEQEAAENLGMAMMYTLVSSAKDWLSEHYGQDDGSDYAEDEIAKEDEVIIPHGEPVTLETFVAWRERYEAELALERAKLMPESALTAPKEKKLTGRQWFESGKARGTVVAADQESEEEEDDEDIDFEDEDFEDDEEDMLEHYLAEKSDARA